MIVSERLNPPSLDNRKDTKKGGENNKRKFLGGFVKLEYSWDFGGILKTPKFPVNLSQVGSFFTIFVANLLNIFSLFIDASKAWPVDRDFSKMFKRMFIKITKRLRF